MKSSPPITAIPILFQFQPPLQLVVPARAAAAPRSPGCIRFAARLSIQTVKMRLHRGRARLIKDLETHCGWFRDARNHLTWDGKIL